MAPATCPPAFPPSEVAAIHAAALEIHRLLFNLTPTNRNALRERQRREDERTFDEIRRDILESLRPTPSLPADRVPAGPLVKPEDWAALCHEVLIARDFGRFPAGADVFAGDTPVRAFGENFTSYHKALIRRAGDLLTIAVRAEVFGDFDFWQSDYTSTEMRRVVNDAGVFNFLDYYWGLGEAAGWFRGESPTQDELNDYQPYLDIEYQRSQKRSVAYAAEVHETPTSRQTEWRFEQTIFYFRDHEYRLQKKQLTLLKRIVESPLRQFSEDAIRPFGWNPNDEDCSPETIKVHLGKLRHTLRRVAAEHDFPPDVTDDPLPHTGGGWEFKLPK